MAVSTIPKSLKLAAPTTAALSANLMKKITAVCLSTIAYCRNLFDESDFCLRSFEGVEIRVIKGTSVNSMGVQCLRNWLQGAFDAMDKNYLKILSFEIKDENGFLMESYTFHYSYHNSEVKLSCEAGEVSGATRHDIRNLIRNILVATSGRESLPLRCTTSVKLQYYHSVTPKDYHPDGFEAFQGDVDERFDVKTQKWICGNIKTDFHHLTVKTRQIEELHNTICRHEEKRMGQDKLNSKEKF